MPTQESVVRAESSTLCLVHQDRQLLHRLGFIKSEADVNLYHIMVKDKQLTIVLYVDDLILTGDDQLIMSCKEDLARHDQLIITCQYEIINIKYNGQLLIFHHDVVQVHIRFTLYEAQTVK